MRTLNLQDKFKTSLTNFLLILILIFLGVIINLLSIISTDIGKMTSNTYATVLGIERYNNKDWTKEEFEKVDGYYKNLWKIWNNQK